MFECTQKACCLLTTINQGSKATSKILPVLFCSAWNFALYSEVLIENFRDVGVTIKWSSKSKIPEICWSNLLEKHQNFKCSYFWEYKSD